MKQFFLFFAAFLFLLLTACTDPITVGADLLDEDRATVGQVMDIPFTTRVVTDSLQIFAGSTNSAVDGLSFGVIEDEVFGKWSNSAYFVPFISREPNTGVAIRPAFAFDPDTDVDSIVFIMQIDTTYALYGPGRNFNLEARKISDRVNEDVDYFSDINLPTEMTLINATDNFSATKSPTQLFDTLIMNPPDSVPHIRVKLSDAFVAEVNARDQNTFNSDSTLATLLAGLYLQALPGAENGLVALRPALSYAGFHFFYPDTASAETQRRFQLRLALSLPRYERDFTGSLVGELLEDGDDQELLAVSGQAGVMTELTFPDLSMLDGKVINKAELKLFQQTIENYSYEEYGTTSFIGLYFRNDAGNQVPINDFDYLTSPTPSSVLRDNSGGQLRQDSDGNMFYNPRLSLHLQNMIEGLAPNKIYLRQVPLVRDPARVILAGPGAPERPATMTVTFTELGG